MIRDSRAYLLEHLIEINEAFSGLCCQAWARLVDAVRAPLDYSDICAVESSGPGRGSLTQMAMPRVAAMASRAAVAVVSRNFEGSVRFLLNLFSGNRTGITKGTR